MSLPARCFQCGLIFESGINIQGSRNGIASGNRQTCPRCGDMAKIADAITDGAGNVHIRDLFQFVRSQELENIRRLKESLEELPQNVEADRLGEELERVDPGFAKFRSLFADLPVQFTITTLIALVALLVAIKVGQDSNRNSRESLELQRQQFEYQQMRDVEEDRTQQDEQDRIRELEESIKQLQNQLEERLQPEDRKPLRRPQRVKGKLRNKPCPCGSGKKTKKCHPYGYDPKIA